MRQIAMLTMPVSPRDHRLGPETATVTLVEYGDYECPYCGSAYIAVKAVQDAMGDAICFGFRNFPLTQVHEYAFLGAMSAEAAHSILRLPTSSMPFCSLWPRTRRAA